MKLRNDVLDPVFAYIDGPIVLKDISKPGDYCPSAFYIFDVFALERIWEERDGVLVPKEGAHILRNADGGIEKWLKPEGLAVRPYMVVLSARKEQEDLLRQGVDGKLDVRYSNKGQQMPHAKAYSSSLFDAEGIGRVELSDALYSRFNGREDQIIVFYKTLKEHR